MTELKQPPAGFRSGFVSILGRPNAGKSTLLNALVGTKVSIVAGKPQTTRSAVQGVWTTDDAQAVFLDTPGIHRSDTLINRRMMGEVRSAMGERDLLLFVVDAVAPFGEEDSQALDLIRKSEAPRFLILNKIDHVKEKGLLLPIIERYQKELEFAEFLPVSARNGAGLQELKSAIVQRLPEGPAYFPPDHITDQPERFMAAEMIREKILEFTHQEIPHAVAVVVDTYEEKRSLTRIAATIYVEREGQKPIVIGAGGSKLKTIGTRARFEMERAFGRKIFLELFVKVQSNWRENPEFLNQLDWRKVMQGSGEEG